MVENFCFFLPTKLFFYFYAIYLSVFGHEFSKL